MYRLALLLALLAGALAYFDSSAGSRRPSPAPLEKVLYHIDSGDRRQEIDALRSVQNNIDAVGAPHLDIKVLLYGDALSILLKPTARVSREGITLQPNADAQMEARVDNLRAEGVTFLICGSCARRRGIDPMTDLYQVDADQVVKNGLSTIAVLQQQGYTYIKP